MARGRPRRAWSRPSWVREQLSCPPRTAPRAGSQRGRPGPGQAGSRGAPGRVGALTPVGVLLVVAVAGSRREGLAVLCAPTVFHHLVLEAGVEADLEERPATPFSSSPEAGQLLPARPSRSGPAPHSLGVGGATRTCPAGHGRSGSQLQAPRAGSLGSQATPTPTRLKAERPTTGALKAGPLGRDPSRVAVTSLTRWSLSP